MMTMKAKLVLHHDDPPCTARLDANGNCPECGVHPYMQSTAFHYYCTICRVPLKNMTCIVCRTAFEKPAK